MSKILVHLKQIDTILYPDSPEPGKFQPSDYNEGHKFTGGTDGQVIIRDSTDAVYGASWSSAPKLNSIIFNLATPATPAHGQMWAEVTGTSPTQVTTVYMRVNGVNLIIAQRMD